MGRRILIVDDEPYILRILSFKLRREGFTTFEAESAENAETLLKEHEIDLVLLDVALATPTNGFDLAAKLRRNSPTRHLPIIMLTARGFASDVLRGREIGAAGYITKPFTAEEVVRRVQSLLDS
ncbi:MAG: response regulator [Acidobacteriota bacterium]|nr:response regulator [Acidobacteriota bacterium]